MVQCTASGQKRGFTLIELMIVISIIGMLASFSLVTLNVARGKARDAKRIVTTRDIITALESYRTVYGHYYCSNHQTSAAPNYLQELVDKGFLTTSPDDPINSYPYVYQYITFKSEPGGPCGQIVELNYNFEFAESSCVLGGKILQSNTHCHVLWPTPLPCPGNEYSEFPSEACRMQLVDDCWNNGIYIC